MKDHWTVESKNSKSIPKNADFRTEIYWNVATRKFKSSGQNNLCHLFNHFQDFHLALLHHLWSSLFQRCLGYFCDFLKISRKMNKNGIFSYFQEAADALFILLTNISLAYKLEKFYSNRYRIQACVRKLNSDLFTPQNEEEEEFVSDCFLSTRI